MIDEEQLRARYKQAVIIALALIYGCVMLGGVFYWFMKTSAATLSADSSLYHQIAVILSGGSLLGSFFVRKIILQKREIDYSAPQENTSTFGSRLTSAMLVPMAMVEGAVMFGIVLAYLSRDLQNLFVPLIVGVIGFTVYFPRYQDWETWTREQ